MTFARSRQAARIAVFALAAIFGSACGTFKERPPRGAGNSVFFTIEPLEASEPSRVAWLATHTRGNIVARFEIELEVEPKNAKLPAFVKVVFRRRDASDPSAFLRELGNALNGGVPAPAEGVKGFATSAVVLGRNLSRGGGGNVIAGLFGSEPSGDWVSTKVFFGEAEVFLNLDLGGGFGEFSIKDPAYARDLMKAFGHLLQGFSSGEIVDLNAAEASEPATGSSAADAPQPAEAEDPRVAALSAKAATGAQNERVKSFEELAKLGPKARSSFTVFAAALQDQDGLVRNAALRGISQVAPDRPAAAILVRPLLRDSDPINQVLAANALADFGEVSEAVTHLTMMVQGRAGTWAMAGLSRLGLRAAPAIPMLTSVLEQAENMVRIDAACRALSPMGREAAPALPALRKLQTHTDPAVRRIVEYTIKEIEGR